MRLRGAVHGWKALSRFALIGVIGGGSAACSTDASRLSDPFTNPFSSITGEPSHTGSLGAGEEVAQGAVPAIRTPRIQSKDLAAPGAAMSSRQIPPAPAATATMSAPAAGAVSGMNPSGLNPDAGRAIKSQAMTPRITPAAPQPKLQFGQGAKPVDTKAEKVAEKKEAEAKAAETRKAAEAKKAADARKAAEAKKVAETKKVAEAKPSSKADAKKSEAAKKAEAETKAARADAAKDAAKKVAEAKAAEAAAKASAKETKVAAKEPPAPAPAKAAPTPEPANTGSVASDSAESFRWPAKGRVINGYGSSGNEGINIAVPEGTPVKAAEDGTVAYAGSDVKGYGKLVLVRHSNGFVSAYAHNGELDVRPGEKVKRGQTIAKSGATGNVTSPQLHFEIRKGATPVDPIPHLASN